jgi:acetoin utilization deacetylase AcuC-like enzyme
MSTKKNDLSDLVRLVYHDSYLTDYPTASCENPDRIRSIMSELLKKFPIVEPEPCDDDDILLCHSEGLLSMEKNDKNRFKVAKLAVGGAIKTIELAISGYISFGVIRPPGHHANPDHNWGFCFFNNMAIAIRKMKVEKKIKSAVILDIDLHFGDGTDTIFKADNDVHVLNIQSPTPDNFIDEVRSSLEEIGDTDIIGISAGFDQYKKDWGANLSTVDYRTIGSMASDFAREKAKDRIFGILEGGYYIPDLGRNALALIEGMCKNRE